MRSPLDQIQSHFNESFITAELKELVRRTRFVAFDFDGVFTDNTVHVFEDGKEAVRCWRGDGIGLRKLEALGISTAIISTEPNPVVSVRSRKLKIRCIQGEDDKLAALEALIKNHSLTIEQAAFVGNDINDLQCLRSVGLPIVVQDAHPDVIPYASYRTKVPGGYGAVREVCDLFETILNRKL